MKIRDRIVGLRRVLASELVPNGKNWRRHPKAQRDALRGVLAEVGYAGALIARELEDGRLMLIDGHLRAETTPEMEVPVLVLDVTEAEADKILLTLDPLSAMADADAEALKALLENVATEDEAVRSHPARFPVGFADYWLKTWPGAVYEPFLGSGTTLVAAEQLARRCFGMEIEPKYVAVALQRLADMGLTPVLESDGRS